MSGTTGAAAGEATPAPLRAIFRLPRAAYVAVVFFTMGITVFVVHPALTLLYLIPIAIVVVIARRSTVVDEREIVVRTGFTRRAVRLPWSDVRGFLADKRSRLSVVRTDGGVIKLPYVRARSLDVLSRVSNGLVPTIPGDDVS